MKNIKVEDQTKLMYGRVVVIHANKGEAELTVHTCYEGSSMRHYGWEIDKPEWYDTDSTPVLIAEFVLPESTEATVNGTIDISEYPQLVSYLENSLDARLLQYDRESW